MSTDPVALRVLASTVNHGVGCFGPVALYVWRQESTPEAIPFFQEALRLAAAEGPGQRCLLFGAAESYANFPNAAMRSALARLFRQEPAIVLSAFTFEGQGFRPSAARSVANAISLLARQPFPHRFFSSTEEAAAWAVPEAERRQLPLPPADAIVRALQALRGTPPAGA